MINAASKSTKRRAFLSSALLYRSFKFGAVFGLTVVFYGIITASPVSVEAAMEPCKVAIAIDRSDSVKDYNPNNPATIKGQVNALINPSNPAGINDPDVEIAFWSFGTAVSGYTGTNPLVVRGISAPGGAADITTSDYPSYTYTNTSTASAAQRAIFTSRVNSIPFYHTSAWLAANPTVPRDQYDQNRKNGIGWTNWQAGLGRNDGVLNTSTAWLPTANLSTTGDSAINLANQADVIVLITDDEPTVPQNSTSPTPPQWYTKTAVQWGADAAQRWRDAGKKIIAVNVGGSVGSLNQIVPSASDRFAISSDYSNLTNSIKNIVNTKCPKRPTCSNIVVTPNPPAPGQPFSVEVSIVATDSPLTGLKARISVTDANPLQTTINFSPTTINPGQTAKATRSNIVINSSGVKTVTYEVLDAANNVLLNCPSTIAFTFPVATRPYLRIYGNDIIAGGRFASGSQCSPNTPNKANATILTYDVVSGSTYTGAGSQFAASALGTIQSFSSAAARNGLAAPTPRHGLTFGNASTGNTRVSTYGGNSGLWRCMPDYFGTRPSTSSGNIHLYSGTTTIPASLRNVGDGVRRAIYVDGSAYISGNVVFTNTSWANLADIPSFYLIVRGDIFIHRDVTQLDGVYIAQPVTATSGGTIYTCVPNSTTKYTTANLHNNCNTKLTINGAFIAKHVKFLRTNGTISSAISNESASNANIAEVFNFSPETYLAIPPLTLVRSGEAVSGPDYDAITSLPPIL